MKSFHGVNLVQGGMLGIRRRTAALSVALLAFTIAMAMPARGQVHQSADLGGVDLSAGGTFSAYYVGYGQRTLLGPSAFVDLSNKSHVGIEAEGRWLNLNETAGVHDSTYLIGPRIAFNRLGRFQPYAKVLVGVGKFTFPYDYAQGNYFVVAPGAGCDFRITRRIDVRLADFEYQNWPDFTYGELPSWGVSSGVRFHLFTTR